MMVSNPQRAFAYDAEGARISAMPTSAVHALLS